MASMFTVASRFRRLKFVGSYLSTIEAVGTGSWLSVVQVLLDVSIALLVAIIEFHGGIQRGYRTISSEFVFVKRYMQSHLNFCRWGKKENPYPYLLERTERTLSLPSVIIYRCFRKAEDKVRKS